MKATPAFILPNTFTLSSLECVQRGEVEGIQRGGGKGRETKLKLSKILRPKCHWKMFRGLKRGSERKAEGTLLPFGFVGFRLRAGRKMLLFRVAPPRPKKRQGQPQHTRQDPSSATSAWPFVFHHSS